MRREIVIMPICTGKRPFTSFREAECVLRGMRKQGYRGQIYVCPQCGLLHIGRKRKIKKQDGEPY